MYVIQRDARPLLQSVSSERTSKHTDGGCHVNRIRTLLRMYQV